MKNEPSLSPINTLLIFCTVTIRTIGSDRFFFHLSLSSNSPPETCVSEASFWKWWEVKTLLNVFRSSQNRRWCHNLASLPPIFSSSNAMNGILHAQNPSLNTQSCIKGPFCCTLKSLLNKLARLRIVTMIEYIQIWEFHFSLFWPKIEFIFHFLCGC